MKVVFHQQFLSVYTSDPAPAAGRLEPVVAEIAPAAEFVEAAPASRQDLAAVHTEMNSCRADLIGISAGFDNHVDDWGGLLGTEDYRQIGAMVRSAADRNGGGCFAILEGGYNHTVLGKNVYALISGMAGGSRGS